MENNDIDILRLSGSKIGPIKTIKKNITKKEDIENYISSFLSTDPDVFNFFKKSLHYSNMRKSKTSSKENIKILINLLFIYLKEDVKLEPEEDLILLELKKHIEKLIEVIDNLDLDSKVCKKHFKALVAANFLSLI